MAQRHHSFATTMEDFRIIFFWNSGLWQGFGPFMNTLNYARVNTKHLCDNRFWQRTYNC